MLPWSVNSIRLAAHHPTTWLSAMDRRALFFALMAAASLLVSAFSATAARAQPYPNKPIKLIVPFAAGGATDIYARSLGAALGAELGQPIVVEARAGVGGLTGVDVLAKSAPDGYTLCLAGVAALSAIPFMVSKMPFDWQKDLALISLVVRVPEVAVVNDTVAANSLAEFVAYARANPGKINFGSAGAGSVTHLGVELLKAEARIDLVHVPYRGNGPAVTDLLGNHIQLLVADVPFILPHVRAGKVKPLAVTSQARSNGMPDVPTTGEAGYPKVNSDNWYGLVAPARTPPDALERLRKATVTVLRSAELKAQYDSLNAIPIPGTPEEFAAYIKSEEAKWGPLVMATGVRLE
jgi:tripartite-type tricarboxylate transporter receptor subunit TctC